MINNIINGLGESLSRSGASTSTTATNEDAKGYYFGSQVVYMTPSQYSGEYAPYVRIFIDAYGAAYSQNLHEPKWDDVVKYGQIVADTYKAGKVFNASEYEAALAQQAAEKQAAESEVNQAETSTPPEVVPPPDALVPNTEEKTSRGVLIALVVAATLGVGAIVLSNSKTSRKRR